MRQVDANFDKYDIPYDVIWLDIEHTDGKRLVDERPLFCWCIDVVPSHQEGQTDKSCLWCRYFTWDSHLFPDPVKLQNDVAAHGRKTVTIIDPHIKKDPGYYIYQEAERSSYFVKNKDGKEYDGCGTHFAGSCLQE